MELSIVLSLTFNRAFGFSVGACRCDFLPFPNLSGPFRYLFTFATYYFSISVRPFSPTYLKVNGVQITLDLSQPWEDYSSESYRPPQDCRGCMSGLPRDTPCNKV